MSAADRATALELIDEACASGARKAKACELLCISVRTAQRWASEKDAIDKRTNAIRPAPQNKLSKEEREAFLRAANSADYCDLSPHNVVVKLADKGEYLGSESTLYRLLRDADLLGHRSRSKVSKQHKPKAYTAEAANQVWCWDITYLPSQVYGQYYYLYLMLDIYSRKVVGCHVHDKESSEYAAALAQQTYIDEQVQPQQLVLHSDNGSPMKGCTMQAMLQRLGVERSHSRPSVSDDNPFAESIFKTLKYHSRYPAIEKFASLEAATQWVETFVQWYNHEHLHSALKYVTPAQKHVGEDMAILAKRHDVYQLAMTKNPARWTKGTRNWEPSGTVTLNPDKKKLFQRVNTVMDKVA